MPHFYRNSRQLFRLFLILVLAMAFLGWRYADQNWRPAAESFRLPSLTEEVDWLTLTADLLEDGIAIFQSAAGN